MALSLVPGTCCICDGAESDPIAVGEDFEYHTSRDTFLAVRCRGCGLVYLDPRPAGSEFVRIYPPTYRSFDFAEPANPIVRKVRQFFERKRLARWIGAADDTSVLDVGCGDGFHLAILRAQDPLRRLAGVELNALAAHRARARGFDVSRVGIETAQIDARFARALMIQTIEHVEDPAVALRAIHGLLVREGRLVIVTDNTNSLDRVAFAGRHWGGYHFPRHLALFDRSNLKRLAERCGFRVVSIQTIVSPVNWVYSIRNVLVDYKAPAWLYERFSLSSVPALAVFTIVDALACRLGRGALLQAVLERR
ncbi:MAG: class I SAM-dependent methyltransferase [Candidatus Eremiobacteraeota bacterium]|nr:class I SAM-dependent methyltransferase [Candidatus Eremiobacteraeota bacterium]